MGRGFRGSVQGALVALPCVEHGSNGSREVTTASVHGGGRGVRCKDDRAIRRVGAGARAGCSVEGPAASPQM